MTCTQCGVGTYAAAARVATRTTNAGVDVPLHTCPACAGITSLAARWRDVIGTRNPDWTARMPWRSFDRIVGGPRHLDGQPTVPRPAVTDLPPYMMDPLDDLPPQTQRWAHIPDDSIAALRAALEHAYWPTTPPHPGGDVFTRPALEAWPDRVACWRCGVPVPPGDGQVVESLSPTQAWITADRALPPEQRRDHQEQQRREAARADAPRAPGAAWRQCQVCSRVDLPTWANRIVTAGEAGSSVVAEAGMVGALHHMCWPIYAASDACTGQLDPGTDIPYAWFDSDWWASELRRQIDRAAPPEAIRHPSGLRCQVCGRAESASWMLFNGLPCCGDCTSAFAPAPPVERDTAGQPVPQDSHGTRQEDGRPHHHSRGAWTVTWDLNPAPPSDVMAGWSWADVEAWRRDNVLCDLDLICAHAAGRSDGPHPGLAAKVDFFLAKDHPHYRRSPAWKAAWSYLADHPSQDGRTLRDAVQEAIRPTPINKPSPHKREPSPADVAHRHPSLRSAAQQRADRAAALDASRRDRENAALIAPRSTR